ncbi:MAG: PQQ-binding-like beta-propeller repeat protein [Thermomicrobiales bacterium]|nr:PQQ-binding-like beta-propeller repeat protein [Thermomicrobiales bacterium]
MIRRTHPDASQLNALLDAEVSGLAVSVPTGNVGDAVTAYRQVLALEARPLVDSRHMSSLWQEMMAELTSAEMTTRHERSEFATGGRGRMRAVLGLSLAIALFLGLVAAGVGEIPWFGDSDKGGNPRTIPAAVGQPNPSPGVPTALLWEYSMPEGEQFDYFGMTMYGSTVYRFLSSNSFTGIEARDARTGDLLWQHETKTTGWPLVADEYGVYFRHSSAEEPAAFTALDVESGRVMWHSEPLAQARASVISDGVLYVSDFNDATVAIDTSDGSVLWTFEAAPDDWKEPYAVSMFEIAVLDNAIATVTTQEDVVLLDKETGRELWRVGGFHSVATKVTAVGNQLVVSTAVWWDGKTATPVASPASEVGRGAVVNRVVSLDLSDGSVRWERYVAGPVVQPVTAGSTFALIGVPTTMDGKEPAEEHGESEVYGYLTGIDALGGDVLWTEALGDLSALATAGSDEAIVLGGIDGISVVDQEGILLPEAADGRRYEVMDLRVADGIAVASLSGGGMAGFSVGT